MMNPKMYNFLEKGHVHTLDDKPLTGITSVMSVIAKPLVWWASGLAVKEFGWTNPKFTPTDERLKVAGEALTEVKELTNEDYLKKLDKAYRAHADSLSESADKGTDLHALLENYVKKCMEMCNGEPHDTIDKKLPQLVPFMKWAKENVKKFLWSEIYCYSEVYWLGGISDCGAEMKDGSIAIIDFKSSKEAYPTQFWQCSGYQLLIEENGGYTKDGKKIFDLEGRKVSQHIVFPFGAKEPKGEVRYDVDKNKKAFLACLEIYRTLGNYEK